MDAATQPETLALPDELTGSGPRSATLSDNARRVAIALLVGFPLILAITVSAARTEIPQLRTRIALRSSNARLAVAQLTSLHSGGRGIEIVEYTFDGAGKQTSGSASVPYDFFQTIRESRQIIIRYLPSNPAINHPDAWQWSPGAEDIFRLFALACFWVGGLAGIVYPIHLLRRRTIIRYGRPALATVEIATRDGRISSYRYTFRSEEGLQVKGKDSTTREIAVGAATWVLFLPQNARRNCLYPSREFEIYS